MKLKLTEIIISTGWRVFFTDHTICICYKNNLKSFENFFFIFILELGIHKPRDKLFPDDSLNAMFFQGLKIIIEMLKALIFSESYYNMNSVIFQVINNSLAVFFNIPIVCPPGYLHLFIASIRGSVSVFVQTAYCIRCFNMAVDNTLKIILLYPGEILFSKAIEKECYLRIQILSF